MGSSQSNSNNHNNGSAMTWNNNNISANSPTAMATKNISSAADQQQQPKASAADSMTTTTSDTIFMTSSPPPQMGKPESFEEKVWRKFSKQPLIPIGCATTAYFLVSGIKSFQKRDPVRSQRMMRNRVMAQFVTIVCFVGYMGLDQFDLRMAPMYQENRKALQQEQAASPSSSTRSDKD